MARSSTLELLLRPKPDCGDSLPSERPVAGILLFYISVADDYGQATT